MDQSTMIAYLAQQLYQALQAALVDIPDAYLVLNDPRVDERMLSEIAIHVYRPVLTVVCALQGRQRPPRPIPSTTLADLQQIVTTMANEVAISLVQIPSLHWEAHISVPWDTDAPALATYLDCITHGFTHIGHLTAIRAFLVHGQAGEGSGMSIPRGVRP